MKTWYLWAFGGSACLGTATAKALEGRWLLAYFLFSCACAWFFAALEQCDLRGGPG